MQDIAEVIEDRGDTVLVRLERHSGCAACRQKCGLAMTSEATHVTMEVDNRLGAKAGQKVRLEVADRSGVLASLIVFFCPLLCMLAGYFVGTRTGAVLRLPFKDAMGPVTSVIFLCLWFVFVRAMDRLPFFSKRFQPQMVEIVDE